MRVSIFKSRSFLLKLKCFNSSRDFFFQVEMFLFKSRFFHVEIFFTSREFVFFMLRFVFQVEDFFFHVEIYISSRVFYLMWRIFSCRHFSFQEENVFLSQVEIFVIFEVFQVDISQFKARCYPGELVGINDKSNKITWRS